MPLKLERGSLIVSCQTHGPNHPLQGPTFMAAMALAARDGGARAIRANGIADVRAVKSAGLPVIGIEKVTFGDTVFITPSIEHAQGLADAGADIIALDCTPRSRPGENPAAIIAHVRAVGLETFADISTLEEGIAAAAMGATYISTTLSGYTPYTEPRTAGPDLDLIRALVAHLPDTPIVAEGRYHSPELARAAIDAGAHAVVVGSMITDPREITKAFAAAVTR